MKGRLKVLVLTEKGKDKIKDVRIERIFNKNASWEHEYWKYRVGMLYRKKTYDVSFEYKIEKGKSVDAVAEKDGIRIAIEIETGKSDYIYNAKKDLDTGFDEILVVALDRKTRDRIGSDLQESGMDKEERVKLMDISELFKPNDV
jgi:hypothetical protein